MTDLETAARAALEALRQYACKCTGNAPSPECANGQLCDCGWSARSAITALETALAAPVATGFVEGGAMFRLLDKERHEKAAIRRAALEAAAKQIKALYPPPNQPDALVRAGYAIGVEHAVAAIRALADKEPTDDLME